MLINISNHPISSWSYKQLDMAKSRWGDVCDIPLPYIDPWMNGEEVIKKAEVDSRNYICQIQQYETPSAFHVMGESVYCFHLIRLLKEHGWSVVASTTTRDVMYVDGDKLSHFTFVKFREY